MKKSSKSIKKKYLYLCIGMWSEMFFFDKLSKLKKYQKEKIHSKTSALFMAGDGEFIRLNEKGKPM